jgi:hypothetical protein
MEESAAESRRLQQQQQQQAAAQSEAAAADAASTNAASPGARGDGAGAAVATGGAAAAHAALAAMPVGSTPGEVVAKFKEALADSTDFKIDVGRGEVVRVRVPNRVPGSTRLVWTFCTEQYDIGFGLDFEVQTEDGKDGEMKVETLLPVGRKVSALVPLSCSSG